MKGFVDGELHPGADFMSEDALAAELGNRAHTVYHPVGTCRMSTDEWAVVDPSLRVRGVDAPGVPDLRLKPTEKTSVQPVGR